MTLTELGLRAVRCPRWRWMPGMAVLNRPMWRVVERVGLPPYMVQGYEEESIDGMTPDLSDPATLGCLLHLVREAYKSRFDPMRVSTQTNIRGEWYCNPHGGGPKNHYHATEAEALVAALEAAP